MATPTPHLDYAQPAAPRAHTRAILLAVAALLLIALVKFVPPAWNHALLLHYQSRCLAHASAPDHIVFDSTGVEAGPARDFERFYALFSPPGGRHDTTLFLGELRRPGDGLRRLVNVEVAAQGAPCPQLYASVIEPGDLWNRPRLRSTDPWPTPFRLSFDHPATLRLHAARHDPKDASHFTIDFTYADRPGTIDGWLRKDDSLLFELRSPLSTLR
jgi:hypothetical protein